MSELVDLSVPIESGCPSEEVPAKIHYVGHRLGGTLLGLGIAAEGGGPVGRLIHFVRTVIRGELLRSSHFPDGCGLSTEFVRLPTHAGTHVDAPYHMDPQGKTIDQVPLEDFYGPGLLIDVSSGPSQEAVSREEIARAVQNAAGVLQPGTVALVRTGAEELFGRDEYRSCSRGLGKEALEYLLDHGVRLVGTDGPSIDQPFPTMHDEFTRGRSPQSLWPSHLLGRDRPFTVIEKLTNLDQLDATRPFTVYAFPVKVAKASAAWSRVVAIYRTPADPGAQL